MASSDAKPATAGEPEESTPEQRLDSATDGGTPMRQGGDFLLTPVVQTIFCRESLSEEQDEIVKMVREFAANSIHPHIEELARRTS